MDYELLIGIALGVLVYIQTIRVDHYKDMYEIVDHYNQELAAAIQNHADQVKKQRDLFNERLPHLRAQIDEEMARLRKESEAR